MKVFGRYNEKYPFRYNQTGFFSVLSDASYLNVYFKKVSKTTGKETDDSFRLPSATLEQAGLLSAEDKQALEDMKSGTPADDVTHPIVIVDEIRPLKDGHYTLETAIAAIVSYQQESGVKYERTGLIITYKTGEYEMETRQFQGAVSDFATPSLWNPSGMVVAVPLLKLPMNRQKGKGCLFNWWRLCLCSGQPRRKRGNRRHRKTSDEERCW